MAYSNTLSSSVPADTDLLSQGDDSIRTLAAALIERLQTAFTDLNAQPLQLQLQVIPDLLITGAKLANNTVGITQLATGVGLIKVLQATTAIADTVPANGVMGGTISVAGAVVGDAVFGTFRQGLGMVNLSVYVSAPDTVTYTFSNPTGGGILLGANLQVTVVKTL